MGMFDYIKCEVPLPDGWQPKHPLQTKDFDCDMVCHIINSDGRLMLERASFHDSNFHGVVNFYGIDEHENWHEYNAKFTGGRLVGIEHQPDNRTGVSSS